MDKTEYSETSIINAVRSYFNNGYSYRIDNAFIFASDWECDFFCVNKEGYSFEIEAKISRADFKADMTKKKHSIFTKGGYTDYFSTWENNVRVNKDRWINVKFMPNRFYYAVPEGLISKTEIPEYAGLIYCGSHSRIIRRAPFIHRNKFDYRKYLCDKFYYRWIEQRRINNLQKQSVKRLLNVVETLEKLAPESQEKTGILMSAY